MLASPAPLACAHAATAAGAASVRRLDAQRVYALLGGLGVAPQGWDVADSVGGAGDAAAFCSFCRRVAPAAGFDFDAARCAECSTGGAM